MDDAKSLATRLTSLEEVAQPSPISYNDRPGAQELGKTHQA